MKVIDTRKTVKIDGGLHKKMRLYVAESGEKISDFLESAIKIKLTTLPSKSKPKK